MAKTSGSPTAVGRIEVDKETSFYGLLPAFRRLGQRLKLLAEARDASESDLDPQVFPGLTITKSELSRLLEREPGTAAFTGDDVLFDGPLLNPSDNANSELMWLAREYDLSSFDLDVILIALATEVDRSYERVFGYLEDDITCKRPSVDLALHLLCPSTRDRQIGLTHFLPDGPLIRHKLLQPDSDQGRSILARELRLDEDIINLLLGVKTLDSRLADFCQLIDSTVSLSDVPIDNELKRALQVLTTQANTEALRLHFRGPANTAKRQTAEALAGQTSSRLLMVVDIEQALSVAPDFDQRLRLVLREARFRNALLYFENVDALLNEERAVPYRQFLKAFNGTASTIIVSSEKPLGRMYEVQFRVPDFAQRRNSWETNLSRRGVVIDAEVLDSLAGSFRLASSEIETAVTAAIDRAHWRAAEQSVDDPLSAQPTSQDLFACARTRSSHNLGRFARKIELKYEWADLVLPADQLSQLSEICSRYRHQHVVYGNWGFGRKLSLGRGLSALFSGHPGTGKTMAAEVIANQLLLDLYKIDLSQVVSKYIGETEKSLNSIFQEAQASNAILFFDEADALFGKRSEVKDAHDRYANIEVSYLLQKMEEYDGIAILATNFRKNIDEAFLRRMQFIIDFPFPDEDERRRIWEGVFPREAPLAADVNFALLARSVRLAGGNLKNIALAAAFFAASDGGVIRKEHLSNATRREYQKLGQSWSDVEY
jgi:AAA+ superfamily predicted ATPase